MDLKLFVTSLNVTINSGIVGIWISEERIAFYPQRVGAINLKGDPGRSDGRDKTCWTKPRSRTDVAVIGIWKHSESHP